MLNPKNILTAHQHARRVSAGAQRAALLLAGTCSNAAGPQHAEHRGGQQAVRIPTAAGAQAQHARVACPDPAPGVPYLPWPLLVGLSQHRHFEETAAGTAVCVQPPRMQPKLERLRPNGGAKPRKTPYAWCTHELRFALARNSTQ